MRAATRRGLNEQFITHIALMAVETAEERWCEAQVNRIAGEIALKPPEPDTAKAEAYLERALAVARKQQAKSLGVARGNCSSVI
jgi:hypothetical protein